MICELYRGLVNVNEEMKCFIVKYFVGMYLDFKYFFCFLDCKKIVVGI